MHFRHKVEAVSYLADLGNDHYRIVVAFSGHSRELTTSGYNSRVDECRLAAEQLSSMAGKKTAKILSDVSVDDYQQFCGALDPVPARRSSHYFGENLLSVFDGIMAWKSGAVATVRPVDQ